MALHVFDLTCEYMHEPLGLDEKSPRLSYKISSEEPDCFQKARRLELSTSADFSSLCADSGFVESDETLFIETGLKLAPCTRYYFRFTVRDSLGREAVSEPSFFETGLMGTPWRAKWITKPAELSDDPVTPRFSRSFRLHETPVSARLYITACGTYRAQINGEYVAPDLLCPGWTSYQNIQQYQTYDVTELLTSGVNELSAIVGSGWFRSYLLTNHGNNNFGNRSALLCRLDLRFADGRVRRIVSDEQFTWADSEVRSTQLYHGEIIDARLCDGEKHPVVILDRGFDMLRGQQSDPVRPIEEIEPIAMITTPRGERVVDFGQNMVGFVRVRVKAPAGREVRIRHFEVLDRDGNAYFENYRSARATAVYITDGKEDVFEALLTFYGFRYICIDAFPVEPELVNFTGVVIHSDLAPTSAFSCSDPMLNQLHHNIVWGQKGNFVDIPTDCPQRDERLGWTGDAQVFCRTACFNLGTGGFFHKWIRDMVADQEESGAIPFVIPTFPKLKGHSGASAWADAVTIIPLTVFRCFGDRRLLEEAFPAMKRWVAYMKNYGDDPYTFCGHSQFGDWLGMDGDTERSCKGGTSEDFVACAFYAYSVQLTADCAHILGKTADEKRYRALHEKVVAGFNREFVSPSGRLCAGPRNQTAYVLALHFNLLSGKAKENAIRALDSSLKDSKDRLTTGFAGTPYLCHVLIENGLEDRAFKLLMQKEFPSWLFSVSLGATTMWEHWDGIRPDGTFWSASMNSYNHYAYGSIGDWIYRHVGGICADETVIPDPARVAYKRFNVAPIPGGGGLSSSDLTFRSPRGDIHVDWTLDGELATLHVTVPANTVAELSAPHCADASKLTVTRDGKPYALNAASELLPGSYTVTYPVLLPTEQKK